MGGYFKEMPADMEAQPPQPDHSIAFSGEWAPPETPADLEGFMKIEAWAKHYPSVDIFDDPEMVKDEEGKWEPPNFEPEPYPVRDCAAEAESETNAKPLWIGRVSAKQNKAHAPVVMRSMRFPGAVVVARGPRFVCFYHGWGDVYDDKIVTPMLTADLVCPAVCADEKYRVHIPEVYEPENPDEPEGAKKLIPPVLPPPYPKEDWKTYNDEQPDLRDKMYLEWEELKRQEKEEEEKKRAELEEQAVNGEN